MTQKNSAAQSINRGKGIARSEATEAHAKYWSQAFVDEMYSKQLCANRAYDWLLLLISGRLLEC